jgi:hypothetical protein
MKANRAYRLIVRRGSWVPAALADPDRVDHIVVVVILGGVVVLFGDHPPREAARRTKALREDLARLSDTEFMARWDTVGE